MSKVYKLGMEHKKFCYDKKTEPAVIIQSGDVVVFETEDANCGLIAKDEDVWPRFQDIYEAAKVDGCTRFQTFRKITLPLLKNTIVLTTLLRTIWEFNSVDLIYSLTGGGPVGKTTTLSMLIANQALTTNNYGYGSAISVISFFILAIVAVIYIKASGFGKESDE